MKVDTKQLELLATQQLNISSTNSKKPNYSNRDFMNALILFQSVLTDKMYDQQEYDKMEIKDRLDMGDSCGEDLRKLIHTYTGLDTNKLEEFL